MRYNRNKPPQRELPDQAPVIPCETLEQANERWEEEMTRHWGFTREEMDIFRRVRSRIQFLEHMNDQNISYQTDLL